MISLIIMLLIVGVILYIVETLLPIDPTIKRLIHIVVIVGVLIYLLRYFAVF